jgi:hypothetical protein
MKKADKNGFIKINPKEDIYWIVNPSLTDKIEKGEPIIKLEWGFDWDENKILMTKSMAIMLRDNLNKIIDNK